MNFFEKSLFISEFSLHFSCIAFFKRLFLEDHFFKVFFEFVTILLLFYVLGSFWPQHMQDLSFPTRD